MNPVPLDLRNTRRVSPILGAKFRVNRVAKVGKS
jgi:hypothetical protein